MQQSIFSSVKQQTPREELTIVGHIPNWIKGEFLRNGPAQFEAGKQSMKHWFDGYALLHKFSISEGKVSYENRFLESEDRAIDLRSGKVKSAQWGTVADPCASIFSKFFSAFQPIEASNANVNIMKVGKRFFAISDFSTLVEFDAETLETKGKLHFVDTHRKKFMLSSAHPSFDPNTGEAFNALCEIGPKGKVHLYKFSEGRAERQILGSFGISKPIYYHSFGLTKDYFIFVEQPLRLNAITLLFGRLRNEPFESHFHWQEQFGNVYHLYHRKSGKITTIKGPAFFFFHSANCFQEGEDLVHIDLCRYDNFDISRMFYLDNLEREGIDSDKAAKLYRVTLNLKTGKVSEKCLSETPIELPQFNKHYALREYQYVYGLGLQSKGKNDFLNCIVKTDLHTGIANTWYEAGSYPSEPIFIPAPQASSEDEGVLLSMVLDRNKGCSKLLVLDAQNLNTLAVAETSALVPPGLHGNFYSKS